LPHSRPPPRSPAHPCAGFIQARLAPWNLLQERRVSNPSTLL